jgi:hypothetical protein
MLIDLSENSMSADEIEVILKETGAEEITQK